MANIPSIEADLFSDDALTEPYEPLPGHPGPRPSRPSCSPRSARRVEVCRRPDSTRGSGDLLLREGVGLKEVVNRIAKGNISMSDGEHHRCTTRRGRPTTDPKSLAALQPEVQTLADTLVDGLVEQGSFDAATDLAQPIPSTWVPIFLVGRRKPESISLTGPMHSFDSLGPLNARDIAAGGQLAEMIQFAQEIAESGGLAKGSLPAKFLDAADRRRDHQRTMSGAPHRLSRSFASTPRSARSAMRLALRH